MVLASTSTFSGSVVRTPSGGEGLPRVRLPEDIEVRASLQSMFRYLHRGFSGVCPDRTWARRAASARFEVAMRSAFVHHGRSGPVGRVIDDGT